MFMRSVLLSRQCLEINALEWSGQVSGMVSAVETCCGQLYRVCNIG